MHSTEKAGVSQGERMSAGGQTEAEESGWKMVAGDVFRPPSDPKKLCVQVGSGVQILTSAFITLFFATLGTHRRLCAVAMST